MPYPFTESKYWSDECERDRDEEPEREKCDQRRERDSGWAFFAPEDQVHDKEQAEDDPENGNHTSAEINFPSLGFRHFSVGTYRQD